MAAKYLTVEHLNTKELTSLFSAIAIDPAIQWNGTPCWIWTRHCSAKGYGKFWIQGRHIILHRFMFAWLVHPIPKGQRNGEIDHLCRNTSCCNPCHLQFITTRKNVLQSNCPPAVNARKTHCLRGHPLTPDNLVLSALNHGRECRTCWNARNRERYKHLTPEQREHKREYLRRWRASLTSERREAQREHHNALQRERYRSRQSR